MNHLYAVACALLFACAGAGAMTAGSSLGAQVQVLTDVELGVDASGLDTMGDVYCSSVTNDPCEGEGIPGGAGSPIVLLFPGAAGPKAEYSLFATAIAEAGYTVMVIESLVRLASLPPTFPEPADLNFPEATATEVALNWFQEQGESVFGGQGNGGFEGGYGGSVADCVLPDTSTVLLVGHSYGAEVAKKVLHANSTLPYTEFTGTQPVENLPKFPEILGAFLFGYANGLFRLVPGPALPHQKILVANGDIDSVTPTINETDYETYITIENLDHFSIADSYFLVGERNMTTLPRDEELALVAEVGIAALNSMVCVATEASTEPPEYVVDTIPGLEDADEAVVVDLNVWFSWLNA